MKGHLPDYWIRRKPVPNNYQCFHLPIDDLKGPIHQNK